MKNYQKEVIAYSKGHGRMFCTLKGYEPCHNAEEVIADIGYDSERDRENPTGSVFCAHGAGFVVSWDEVKDYMHIESYLQKEKAESSVDVIRSSSYIEEEWIDTEEIDKIIAKTFYATTGDKTNWKKGKPARNNYSGPVVIRSKPVEVKEEYLLVDGYNIIFAWEELNELARTTIDGARHKLMDILCNYQGYKKCTLILVFDAYKVTGNIGQAIEYHNIHVVYTKEAETADQYIEKLAHKMGRNHRVTVATSDGLEQLIIRGQGCHLMSARDLKEEVNYVNQQIRTEYLEKSTRTTGNKVLDQTDPELAEHLEKIRQNEPEQI